MNQPPVITAPSQNYYGDNNYSSYSNGYNAAPPVESDSGLGTVGYIFLRLILVGVVIAIKVAIFASMR